MSIFDDPNEFIRASELDATKTNIALFHGSVHESLTDVGYVISNRSIPVSIFNGYDMVLLGDIHKHQVLQEYDKNEGKPIVDFNKIIPKPEILDKIIADGSDTIVNVLFGDLNLENPSNNILQNLQISNFLSSLKRKDIQNMDDERFENLISVTRAKREFGYTSWYDWSSANWGTKWNAYEALIENGAVKFDTAWATPLPVIEKLSKMFPDEEIHVRYADEDYGSNYGEFIIKNGNRNDIEVKDPIRFALTLKGEEIPEYCKENDKGILEYVEDYED
jgi:hypothetical protein